MQDPSFVEAIIAACGLGGSGILYKVNSKAQRALDKTKSLERSMDKRLQRIEDGVDTLTKHLLNK